MTEFFKLVGQLFLLLLLLRLLDGVVVKFLSEADVWLARGLVVVRERVASLKEHNAFHDGTSLTPMYDQSVQKSKCWDLCAQIKDDKIKAKVEETLTANPSAEMLTCIESRLNEIINSQEGASIYGV